MDKASGEVPHMEGGEILMDEKVKSKRERKQFIDDAKLKEIVGTALNDIVTELTGLIKQPTKPTEPTVDRPAGLREIVTKNLKIGADQRDFFENIVAADILESRNEKRAQYNREIADYNRQQTLATERQHLVSTAAGLTVPLLVNSIGQQFAQVIDHRDLSYDKLINIDEQIWAVLALALGALSKPVYQDAVMALMITWLTDKGYTVVETTTETTKE